jgi:hypothetical protein
MTGLESQEEDTPNRLLFFNPKSCLGRSGLTVEMKPGLLVSGRLSFPWPWAPRSRSWPWETRSQKYHFDYNNNPPSVVSFMPAISSTSGRLHIEFIRLLFLQTHRETDRFFAASGVQLAQPNRGLFHFHRTAFSTTLRSKVGSTLTKAAPLRVNLNIDGTPTLIHRFCPWLSLSWYIINKKRMCVQTP